MYVVTVNAIQRYLGLDAVLWFCLAVRHYVRVWSPKSFHTIEDHNRWVDGGCVHRRHTGNLLIVVFSCGRDDYICARTPDGNGACIPPYFLFQLRVDGHAGQ